MKNTAILLLAAGSSSRLGQPKQLVEFHGKPLLQHIIEMAIAVNVSPIIVVLGAHFKKIKKAISAMPIEVVENSEWESGMGSSVAAGMRFLQNNHPEVEAVLLLVCDQYLLDEKDLEGIFDKWEKSGAEIVASKYGSTFGVPALFAKPLFGELTSLSGKAGAKKAIQRHLDKTVFVEFENGGMDLDTPEDMQKMSETTF